MESSRLPSRLAVVLRTAAVTKVFGSTVALWDVDFACRSGELIAIHGANGSGKSTLLRILAGLMAPTRGSVTLTGEASGGNARVGFLGHMTHLFDELTAIENVELAARLAGRDETAAIGPLSRLGVVANGGQRVATLSAGMRRRVGLARLLATDPDVVLVDEPLAGLDARAADVVTSVLGELRDDGYLVVIATHDAQRSRLIATRAVRLENGRIRRDAPLDAEATVG